jgi:hypothetical protein
MGKMHIAVDAKNGGKKSAFRFRWEGDDAAIRNLISAIEKEAASAGVTGAELTDSCLMNLSAMGLRKNENDQHFQLAAIVYTLLNLPISPPISLRLRDGDDIQANVSLADRDSRIEVGTPQGKDWVETLELDEVQEGLALLDREGDDVFPVADRAGLVKALEEREQHLIREELHGHRPERHVQHPDGRWTLRKERHDHLAADPPDGAA